MPVQAPGQGKPSSSGRARKRTIEDLEEEDLFPPDNGRKRHILSWLRAKDPNCSEALLCGYLCRWAA